MKFEDAIEALKSGKAIRRNGWLSGWWVRLGEGWTKGLLIVGSKEMDFKAYSIKNDDIFTLKDALAENWEIME